MANYNVNISKKMVGKSEPARDLPDPIKMYVDSSSVRKAMIIEKMKRNEEKSKASSK